MYEKDPGKKIIKYQSTVAATWGEKHLSLCPLHLWVSCILICKIVKVQQTIYMLISSQVANPLEIDLS